jgi:hypothetical protein
MPLLSLHSHGGEELGELVLPAISYWVNEDDSRVPFLLLVDVAYVALREEMSRRLAGMIVPPPSWLTSAWCPMTSRGHSTLAETRSNFYRA